MASRDKDVLDYCKIMDGTNLIEFYFYALNKILTKRRVAELQNVLIIDHLSGMKHIK